MPRMTTALRSMPRFLLALAALPLLAACGGGHHLADYSFRDRTLAVVYASPPAPGLYTGGYGSRDSTDLLRAVVDAGSRVAKELEGRRARARLDSAAVRVDVAGQMAERLGERAGRYLGTRPVQSELSADFLLELDVLGLGIDASGSGAATLFINAEAILLDARSGREIWSEHVRAWDRITARVDAVGLPTDAITAGMLSTVTVDEFERLLRRLVDLSADAVTRELREDLRDVRS